MSLGIKTSTTRSGCPFMVRSGMVELPYGEEEMSECDGDFSRRIAGLSDAQMAWLMRRVRDLGILPQQQERSESACETDRRIGMQSPAELLRKTGRR